jgi:hypothetical protein
MSLRPSPQNSSTALDAHFEPYTDSVNQEDTQDTNEVNVRVQPVRDEVGRPARPWRRVLTGSAWTSSPNEDAQLAEQPTPKKRSCRSRFLRGLVRTHVGILIMLLVNLIATSTSAINLQAHPN